MKHVRHDHYIYGHAGDGRFHEFSFNELTLRPSEVVISFQLGLSTGSFAKLPIVSAFNHHGAGWIKIANALFLIDFDFQEFGSMNRSSFLTLLLTYANFHT